MCWYFDGLVPLETGGNDVILLPTNSPWTLRKCGAPDHTYEDGPARDELPLDYQWQIASWASEYLQLQDPATAAKFQRIVKEKISLGHDQSIFDKYRLRIRKGYQLGYESESRDRNISNRPISDSFSSLKDYESKSRAVCENDTGMSRSGSSLATIPNELKLELKLKAESEHHCLKCDEMRNFEISRRDSGMYLGAEG